jgi:nicotinamide mononucleotide adenylyltransferase
MSAADFVRNPDKKTIVFTIGRMNPPTSGHLKLIQTMMEKAFELNENKIYIILSHTQDNKTNPLYCSRKRELLTAEGMINKIKRENPDLEKIEVKIRCMDDPVDERCGSHVI